MTLSSYDCGMNINKKMLLEEQFVFLKPMKGGVEDNGRYLK